MKLPRWLIRTKPNFTINEGFVWIFAVGLSIAVIPPWWFGLSIGVALGFVVVIAWKRIINAIRLKPWAKKLMRREYV